MSQINQVIRTRRSVYPNQYIDNPIPREIIEELLENANHAPTHRLTEPWRFKVFEGEGKTQLGHFLAEKYKETATEFVQAKYDKTKLKADQSGAIIAIILHRDPEERVPEWEEIAAVACAVQNMWVALGQYDLGGYWSTPKHAEKLGELVELGENERCLGLFYLGACEPSQRPTPKKAVAEKVTWH